MKLSPRQKQIAELIADGFSYTEISDKLGITTSTVNLIALQARRKKGVKTNGQMSALVWKKRLQKKTYNNDSIPAT